MNTYSFTLVLTGEYATLDALEDALFDAGCDDALLMDCDGVAYLDVDRTGAALSSAVLSAIHDVNGSGVGVRVLRVEPDGFVTGESG